MGKVIKKGAETKQLNIKLALNLATESLYLSPEA